LPIYTNTDQKTMLSPDSLDLLFKLSDAHAVPGFEDEVRNIFRKKTEKYGKISVDRIGNIYCTRPNTEKPHLAVDCHMDEVGFMVQSITPEGFLKVLGLGGWSTTNLPAQPVVVMGRHGKIPGVFGSIPPHFLKDRESPTPTMEDMYVDIGATSDSMVRSWGVRAGSPVCPDITARASHNPDRVMGKAFDNRVGCAICIETAVATAASPANVTFIGAVQEEGGLRGATVSSRSSNIDLAVVIEGAPADDAPGVLTPMSQGLLGKGTQIRCYDPTHIANSKLVDWVVELAESEKIPYQLAVWRSGGTNAGRYHLEGKGIPTVVLGVPSRYIHSHQSMIDLNDYAATRLLVQKIVEKMDAAAYQSLLPV
jgi:putative aminopeptidase FrvX